MPKQNDLPTPVTYGQKFYAKAAGMDVELPEAITPEQKYLMAIAERGESIGNIGDVEIDNPENGEVMKYDAEQGKWINGTASGGGGTSDYTDLTNKPKINNVTLAGNKSLDDIGAADASEVDTLLSGKVDKVTGKGLSTEDYTTAEKTKLAAIEAGAEANVQADWNQTDTTADDYIKNKPTIQTVNDATLTIQKNGTAVGTFSANAATAATINITVPVDADDVSALPDTTKYGASLALSIDSSTYIVTATMKDQDGNTLGTAQTIDLPLETVVVGGSYDDATKKVILTLKNGNTIDFSVADLVAGLQTEITSTNKLDADLVDDTASVHKFVTAADKTAWNAKSDFSGDYDDLTNKPTIPAAQVNADWNAVSGVAQILNKPAIYTKTQTDTLLDGKLDAGSVSSTGTEATGWNNCRLSGGKIQYYNTDTTYSLATTSSSGLMSASDKQKLNDIDTGATKTIVDTALSGTSTNPVQNKAVQAPIARLVDAGAKNLLNLGTGEINPSVTTRGVTWTKDILTGAVIANGTSESSGSYPSISMITLKPGTYFMCGGTQRIVLMETSTNARDYGNGVSFTVTNNTAQPIQILAIANANMTFNDEVIYPMVCSSEDYAVSPTIQPYVPTNLELYEMILALQNAQNGG